MSRMITVDESLIEKAASLTGIEDNDQLIQESLRTLVQLESSKRLAALGGYDPYAQAAPRYRDGR